MISYYILDSETTGLKAGHNEIIQLSIIRVADGAQITKNIRAKYPNRAHPEALKVIGKTYSDLKEGMEMEDAIAEIDEFYNEDERPITHRCTVAHNASFDKRHCHATWGQHGKRFPGDLWLCTMAFTRKYAKKEGMQKIAEIQGEKKASFKLEKCLTAVGLEPKKGAHNAVIDTYNTLQLFNYLMKQNLGHASVMKTEPHVIAGIKNDLDKADLMDMI